MPRLRNWYGIAVGFEWVKLELSVNVDLTGDEKIQMAGETKRGEGS